jgi:large subunit ribosomal protein L5
MFHENDQDRIDKLRGMDITFVTTAANDDEGRALLKALGFPFKAEADEPPKVTKKRPAFTGKKKK